MKSFRYAGAGKLNMVALLLCMIPAAAEATTSTHCLPAEQVIFSCSVGKKVVSICASDALGPASGTAQYRFGALGKIELKIPAQPQHPTTFSRLGVMRGPAWVDTHIRVANGEYAYTVYEGEGKGWQRAGVLVSKQDGTLANLSCVAPTSGIFSDVVYSDAPAFAVDTDDQMARWLDVINATQNAEDPSRKALPVRAAPVGSIRSGRGKDFVLDADFNPGIMLPVAASAGCTVESPPRFSLQTSEGTVHVDEYRFPYGCFGDKKNDATLGVGYVIPQNGSPPLGFRYRKGGRAELLRFLGAQ
ncbi:hypothetical protein FOC84_09100 [Achromobacter pestifer]|uniref:Uncharacterized protein n=1 Tax=Achromobacter pestifer TaxID=1353889 RepID=A0A7D4DWC0_9BURK|nr:hypothetical protein [Achromobacter pestifer]QKH35088.1 hypothetical protein FOC84_09100 [Achromobacter pestifer]